MRFRWPDRTQCLSVKHCADEYDFVWKCLCIRWLRAYAKETQRQHSTCDMPNRVYTYSLRKIARSVSVNENILLDIWIFGCHRRWDYAKNVTHYHGCHRVSEPKDRQADEGQHDDDEKQRTVRVRSSVERHRFNKIRCTTGICGRWQHLALIPPYDDEIKWWKRMNNSSQMTKQRQKCGEDVRIWNNFEVKIFHSHWKTFGGDLARLHTIFSPLLSILKRIKNYTNSTPLHEICRYEPYSCQRLHKKYGEFGRFTSTDMNADSSKRPQNLYAYFFSSSSFVALNIFKMLDTSEASRNIGECVAQLSAVIEEAHPHTHFSQITW